jgi:hypothetical protein
MRTLVIKIESVLRRFWSGLRQWCGDSAYETYVAYANRRQVANRLSPRDFYVEQLNGKYSRPNRCC